MERRVVIIFMSAFSTRVSVRTRCLYLACLILVVAATIEPVWANDAASIAKSRTLSGDQSDALCSSFDTTSPNQPVVYHNAESADMDATLCLLSVTSTFSPVLDDAAAIKLRVLTEGRLTVEILEPDRNIVAVIADKQIVSPGEITFDWDGRDEQGMPVPDESYTVRAHLTNDEDSVIAEIDSAAITGGERLTPTNVQLARDSVSFYLNEPARTLVRVGTRNGPMHRTLLHWKSKPEGANRIPWNGKGAGDVIDLGRFSGTTVMVAAFSMPEFSMQTVGNTEMNYHEWFAHRQFKPLDIPPTDYRLQRGDKALAREFYYSRFEDREPLISVELLVDGQPLKEPYLINDSAILRVSADPDSQWRLTESLFEVGFFVDNVFVAEEEQGFLPLSWRLSSKNFQSGDHILTVNVSGFDGSVGVASLLFTVPETLKVLLPTDTDTDSVKDPPDEGTK